MRIDEKGRMKYDTPEQAKSISDENLFTIWRTPKYEDNMAKAS